MQTIVPLKRANVSEAVAGSVRALIVDGRLPEAERVNEVRLAALLGVSRTPLREALSRLGAEGALESRPGLGYFVRALTLGEFEQLYAIRPLLDPEALRLAGLPSAGRLARLRRLNRTLGSARSPEAAVAGDEAWHRELLADCPNRVLLELIEHVELRTRRYELALMRETHQVSRATEDHEAIARALDGGDLPGACAALKRNLENGFEPIAAWLQTRHAARTARR
jgi:DNA-binding GntR family transcriptional regulator